MEITEVVFRVKSVGDVLEVSTQAFLFVSLSMEEEDFVVSGEDAVSDAEAGSWVGSDWGSTASGPERLPPARKTARTGRNQRTGRASRRATRRQRGSSEEEELLDSEEEDEMGLYCFGH